MSQRIVRPGETRNPLTAFIACSVIVESGEPCGQVSATDAPFPICDRHIVVAYRHVSLLLGRQLVAETRKYRQPNKGRATVGCAMNGHKTVVYYARIGDHIKIGTTKNLVERMNWYPPSSQLLALEPGGQSVEYARHEQFRHLLAARTEWFDPGPDLMVHVERLAVEGLPAV